MLTQEKRWAGFERELLFASFQLHPGRHPSELRAQTEHRSANQCVFVSSAPRLGWSHATPLMQLAEATYMM